MSPRLIPVPPLLPQRGNAFSKGLGLFLLWLLGWRIRGTLPNVRQAVAIVAPHTSNYDGLLTVVSMLALGLRISFFVKHSAFRWPVAGLMRWFGALPVNRGDNRDLVAFSAGKFAEKPELMVAIAPEGTRHSADSWKSGFYWIAHRAGVPILPVAFDYARREIIILDSLQPSGDLEQDMPALLQRYRGITPAHPERLSRPLRDLPPPG